MKWWTKTWQGRRHTRKIHSPQLINQKLFKRSSIKGLAMESANKLSVSHVSPTLSQSNQYLSNKALLWIINENSLITVLTLHSNHLPNNSPSMINIIEITIEFLKLTKKVRLRRGLMTLHRVYSCREDYLIFQLGRVRAKKLTFSIISCLLSLDF